MPGSTDDVTMTFGGNATMLLRVGPFTLLTDRTSCTAASAPAWATACAPGD